MPTYEYLCQTCNIEFEQLLIQKDEIEEYQDFHPCPKCGELSPRIPSAVNFQFKGNAEGDPTKPGSSGVHDLDYPSVDKAVGRSANRRWKQFNERKAQRDKARRELGTNTIAVGGLEADAGVQAISSDQSKIREKGIKTFKEALKSNSESK